MTSPYFAKPSSVSIIMFKVLLALVPAIAVYVWYFGPSILVAILLASITALVSEAVMLKLRKYPVKAFLLDGSALVTAWLLALSLPPLGPWWLYVTSAAFAIIVAKQLYGGLGNNPFNPAMIGFAVMIISFPKVMTQWIPPEFLAQAHLSFADQMRYMFLGILPQGFSIDAITSATPLTLVGEELKRNRDLHTIFSGPLFGMLGGKGFEAIALAYLVGGIYMWQQRIITWHVPVAFCVALAASAGALHLINPARYADPLFHLATTGAMLGAFFIATDPVSGPTTPKGKLIFAAAAGFLTYIIRTFGGYPDGVAFAILLMNICVPLIDAYTQPPVFGRKGKPTEKPE